MRVTFIDQLEIIDIMNRIKNTTTVILMIISLISCKPNSINAQTVNSPEEFGKQFTSVCKVGVKGGDGTLVDKNWVLTAGHVAEGIFKRSNGEMSVYFENGSEYRVEKVFLHPKYRPMGKYDLALLKLKRNVDAIKPIQIYTRNDELNRQIILAGHGDKRAPDNSWIQDGKLRAYTNIVDDVNDTYIIFDYDSPENNPTDREGTSGPGDSGGPAFIRIGDNHYIAGVSSMGKSGRNGAATYGAVEYFVRISMFQNWIKETILNPDLAQAISLDELVTIEANKPFIWSKSKQAKYAKLFISALENYSKEKMIDAISKSFDPAKLEKLSAEKITESIMPTLINELRGAKLLAITSESSRKMSFELRNNDLFGLDIFFNQNSNKIEQIAYGKFD